MKTGASLHTVVHQNKILDTGEKVVTYFHKPIIEMPACPTVH
jgi:hypothetical protein